MRTIKNLILLTITIAMGACTALSPPPEFKGAVYGSPAPPPDFTLPSTRGGDFTLSEQEDVVTMIFFGYTFCPDVCPQTLGVVRSALGLLTEDERSQIDFVFITSDPGRDTLSVMTGYLARFDPAFIGVRPEPDQLAGLTGDYDAFVEPAPPDESGSYEVTHTSVIYVVDKAGNMRLGFFSGMSPEDMASDLRILVNE